MTLNICLLGISLSDSTQYDQCKPLIDCATPVYEYLKQEGANSNLVFHDDTGCKILSLIQENRGENPPKRTGMHTTALVFEGKHNITLYITGRKHAGENLDAILNFRDKALPPINQMSDGLAANNPKNNPTIAGNCLAHGRRKFVEIECSEPAEAAYMIDSIGKTYYIDKISKEEKMSDQERLFFHQQHSKPIMDQLHEHMQERLDNNTVEANSALGKAFRYMLKLWDGLTCFLREAGAPLDNNNAERAIKIVARYRKNSFIFVNTNGSYAGDVIMSLAETSRQNDTNAITYFTALMRNETKVCNNPEQWLPWNYHENFDSSDPPPILGNFGSHRVSVPQEDLQSVGSQ